MKVNKIIAGIMAVCVMGFGVPYVNTVVGNNSAITASAGYTTGTYELLTYKNYKNYGGYIEISKCDESATDVVIPSEIEGLPVKSIGEQAFSSCSSLTSVEIPDSVTSIGERAFSFCSSLTSVEIPDSVTSIEGYAFNYCSSLESIAIPCGVTYIKYNTFSGCESLTSVEIPNSVTNIGKGVFNGCIGLTSIKIPESVTSIGDSAFYECRSLTSIEIPESVTSIEGYAFSYTPWLEEKQKENPFVVVNNILINAETCSGDVVIPDSVKSIGDSAFCGGSSSLTSVEIPDSVTSIGGGAFNGCISLKSIEIPDSVTSISGGAFYCCSGLKEIIILNPECNIYDSDATISNGYDGKTKKYYFDGTIYGYENSTAQAYAEKHGYKFVFFGTASEKETATGDMNGDNSVNIADAVLLQQYILGSETLTEEQLKSADLTGDGFVDSFDMVLLRRKVIENNK